MVKPDYNRDYYADLELTASADVAEIKRQFRKLALRYHPDRNPGKEDAVKDMFLVIQTAHEILTDAALKAKYDANRKRTTFTTASGVKGNPYQNVSADVSDRYGAPPRRRAPAPTRPSPASPYASWVPPQARPKQGDASENLRAWDRMRSAGSRAAQAATTAASAAAAKATRSHTKTEMPQPPPRTAYQARQQEASFGTRKTGFAPASPLGDEPPVKNHHYTNMHNNVFEETAANLKQSRPPPAAAPEDPLSEMFEETFLDNRQRTPYVSHAGERTNLFEGASNTRAKSVRDAQRRRAQDSDEDNSPQRPQRQRSASVGEPEGFKPSEEGKPFVGFGPTNFGRFTSQASARYSPRPPEPKAVPSTAGFAAFAAPNASTPSAKNGTDATAGGAPQTNRPKVYDPYDFPCQNPSQSYLRPSPLGGYGDGVVPPGGLSPFASRCTRRPAGPPPSYSAVYNRMASGTAPGGEPSVPTKKRRHAGTATPSGETPGKRLNLFEASIQAQLQKLLSEIKLPQQAQQARQARQSDGQYVARDTNTTHPISFAVPDDADDDDDDDVVFTSAAAEQARFMRNSSDNLNTVFTNDKNYVFNAGGGPVTQDPFLRAKQRARSSPRGRQSPLRNNTFASSTESFTNLQEENAAHKAGGFDAQEWTAKFGPHNFVPPPVARKSVSPTRQGRPIKKAKPVRMTAGTAGLVEEEDTSGEDRHRPTPVPDIGGTRSPNAMDIDTPPPAPSTPQTSGARTINVEPYKPEWRAGDVNGTGPQPGVKLGTGLNIPKPHTNVVGSEDTDDLAHLTFAEFQKVEPFTPTSSGLAGFAGDMKNSLPFDSKASAKLPLQRETPKGVPSEFPEVPVPPRVPPALAVSDLKPNKEDWRNYVLGFTRYLEKWAGFEKRIADHFAARNREGDGMKEKRFDWTNALSDAGGEKYLQDMAQDKYIRQKWMMACDAHELRVKEFMRHRLKMKQAVAAT